MERLFSNKKISKSRDDINGYLNGNCTTCDVSCGTGCTAACGNCGTGCKNGCAYSCVGCDSCFGSCQGYFYTPPF